MGTFPNAEKTQQNNEFSNVTNWWEHGYTGKGVAVWNMEGYTAHSGHGKTSRKRIFGSAPDATVYSGAVNYGASQTELKDPVVQWEQDEDLSGKNRIRVPLEEFIATHNIKVINASLSPAPFSYPGYKTHPEWKRLIEKYDLCCFASSANDSDKNKTFDNSDFGWWYVGAMYMYGGKTDDLRRHGYSNGGEGLDFIDFTGDWSGTSSSSPYLAGKCALVRQRFPQMNRFEVYEYMKEHCMDLGDAGEDKLFGHGLFILPPIKDDVKPKGDDDVEITKTKVLVDGQIKEVKRVMVNNENYIRLRDMEDVLGICDVDYDAEKNLPIVRKG